MNILNMARKAKPNCEKERPLAHVAIFAGTTNHDDEHKMPVGSPILTSRGFFVHEFSATISTQFGPRRALAPGFEAWNGKERIIKGKRGVSRVLDPIGRREFHAIVPVSTSEQLAAGRFHCQEPNKEGTAKARDYIAPVGLKPFCSSKDGVTAQRWQPATKTFKTVPCTAAECPFYQSGDCKMRSGLSLILNEPDCPKVLAYVTTGSADNGLTFGSFVESVEEEWRNLCGIYRIDPATTPIPWYGFPVIVEHYMAYGTGPTGVKTQFPRIRLKVDGTLHEIFMRQIRNWDAGRSLMAGMASVTALLPAGEPNINDMLDAAEQDDVAILSPDTHLTPTALDRSTASQSRLEAALGMTPPAPVTQVIDVQVEEEGPDLLTQCREVKKLRDVQPLLKPASDAGIEAISALLESTFRIVESADMARRESFVTSAIQMWRPFDPDEHAVASFKLLNPKFISTPITHPDDDPPFDGPAPAQDAPAQEAPTAPIPSEVTPMEGLLNRLKAATSLEQVEQVRQAFYGLSHSFDSTQKRQYLTAESVRRRELTPKP